MCLFGSPRSVPRYSCTFTLRRWVISFCAMAIYATGPLASAATAKCTVGKLIEFQTTVSRSQPVVTAKIDGTDVRFVLDSGAFFSFISPASAAALKLRTFPAPPGFSVRGVGGSIQVNLTRVATFDFNGIALHDVEFVVGGNDIGGNSIGLLGRNVLQMADAEYDLAQGMVRILMPHDCEDVALSYWTKPGDSYSVMSIAKPRESQVLGSHVLKAASFKEAITGVAYVNGVEIRVMFDTGAETSFLTVKAAARAGIKLGSGSVVPAGYNFGVGRSQVATYLAPVSSFKIGDEEIRNTRLRLGDTEIGDGVDMLIGADFFLSHHIYVANSQHKLYFTYNGGPVFNLGAVAATSSPPSPAASAEPPQNGESHLGNPAQPDAQGKLAENPDQQKPAPSGDQTMPAIPLQSAAAEAKSSSDAGDYARRGEAFASRQEFDQAITALTKACQFAPDNPEYFYQRGVAYAESNQVKLELADLNRTIELKPNHVPALLARGELRIRAGDKAGAEADLNAANDAVPKEDAARYSLAGEYWRLGLFRQTIQQYDLWIVSHPVDVNLPSALNWRCRARALENVDLKIALDDCNKALKHAAKASPFYAEAANSRGLVFLRLGDYEKSIADYDASLKIKPRDAWALYARGLDEMRAKKISEGQADMAQATTISPKIGETFSDYGLLP